MTRRSETGKIGEDIACEYLLRNRYQVIERNYWKPWGEIDIIAQDPGGELVVIEVKTMNSRYGEEVRRSNPATNELSPEDQMTAAKLQKLRKVAGSFANERPELIKSEKGWRIDLVAVTLFGGDRPAIKHYKNI
jgi:Holliday junction resolvase-like predicted endonuclease